MSVQQIKSTWESNSWNLLFHCPILSWFLDILSFWMILPLIDSQPIFASYKDVFPPSWTLLVYSLLVQLCYWMAPRHHSKLRKLGKWRWIPAGRRRRLKLGQMNTSISINNLHCHLITPHWWQGTQDLPRPCSKQTQWHYSDTI